MSVYHPSMADTLTSDSAEDAPAIAQAVFQAWQQNNQQAAVDQLRPYADSGRPWAVSLLTFLYNQQGIPGFTQAVPYAKRAQALGMPWLAATLFNNLISNVPGNPNLLDPALELLEKGPILSPGIDPVAQAWNFLSQNRPDVAVRLLSASGPYPAAPEEWNALVQQARNRSNQLDTIITEAQSRAQQVETVATESTDAIVHQREHLQTIAQQAELLVTDVSADAINTLYKADATRWSGESRTAWQWGIGILLAAALSAVLPVILHYADIGPKYSSTGLAAAHLAATAALATVAGVILARARGRDRAAQRSSNVSTAMATMIALSNQIANEDERQRFMVTMGQLVFQAHLQPDSAPPEQSLVGLATVLSAMRSPGA